MVPGIVFRGESLSPQGIWPKHLKELDVRRVAQWDVMDMDPDREAQH